MRRKKEEEKKEREEKERKEEERRREERRVLIFVFSDRYIDRNPASMCFHRFSERKVFPLLAEFEWSR